MTTNELYAFEILALDGEDLRACRCDAQDNSPVCWPATGRQSLSRPRTGRDRSRLFRDACRMGWRVWCRSRGPAIAGLAGHDTAVKRKKSQAPGDARVVEAS